MATVWSRLRMATTAAVSTFMRVYSNPEDEQRRQAFESRQTVYNLRWAYYNNSVFDDLVQWSAYKGHHRLYRFTRSIYNPACRLVDFYAGAVYPGRLSIEPGTGAIPLNEDTPQPLSAAIRQVWQWSNWQANKSVMTRWGSALGEMLVEVIDDVDRGQVYAQNTWPGLVNDLELDAMGNVKAYTLEYDTIDPATNVSYTYRKEVDGRAFRELRNKEVIRQYANPYGFVPACWVVHRNEGGMYGSPAMRNLSKLDELNSLAAHTLDQIHKLLSAPVLIAGERISKLDGQTKGTTSDQTAERVKQESIDILRGSADASVHNINMTGTEQTMIYIESLLTEIERDHPELGMYNQLREMSQVTGPGASRLFGDVEKLVMDAQANYDQQTIKALQMAVAIGGWRLQQGDWIQNTRQQEAFAGFDLDSYRAGDLDFTIDERPLIPLTEQERLEIERQKLSLESDRQGLQAMNQPGAIASRLRQAAVAA